MFVDMRGSTKTTDEQAASRGTEAPEEELV
jgi:hypothetical protein